MDRATLKRAVGLWATFTALFLVLLAVFLLWPMDGRECAADSGATQCFTPLK